MDRNALAELLQALESRRDAEERRREERYTALIERVLHFLKNTAWVTTDDCCQSVTQQDSNPARGPEGLKTAELSKLLAVTWLQAFSLTGPGFGLGIFNKDV
ncbi:UNVERIFIED_CONTAM: hypothetical protein FKN15_002175 [Acipenser sinensis]